MEKISATSGNFKLLNQQVENIGATSGKLGINMWKMEAQQLEIRKQQVFNKTQINISI